ncbi:initiation factor 2 [Rhizodiscina lignyota]|uniref:Translation initiation factor IF-2, mitochondrial n=1 Tax=Rhizodiscina lignyota TaxID=1504668 RepID=A0A9P4ICN3_9PEZI|nr:initiation factor 2 [Rhizodiscina lignyota]
MALSNAGREERRRQKDMRRQERSEVQKDQPRPINIPEFISVGQLATALNVPSRNFDRKLKQLGFGELSHDHVLNSENAGLIAMEFNFEPVVESADDDLRAAPLPEDMSVFPQRPPVVTIMGHVDHGKTTLLDFLRKSSVAANEHGGITQHIGAFNVLLESGKSITFLDTPGHAAFLSMRQRGANVTDIVILVVAADDSVMPQTLEAIKHAKTADVPMIVAINKMDKADAAPERVKSDLARHGVEIEDIGGDTQAVYVSGKTGLGMEELEEAVVTLSEILDHRADPSSSVEGWILESSTKSNGRVATVLVRSGTLRPGDIIVAGATWARVRTLKNEAGALVEEVGPGMPAEVDGWRDQPVAGDELLQAPTEQKATEVVDLRLTKQEQLKMAEDTEAINEARRREQEKREKEERAAKGQATDQEATQSPEDKAEVQSSGPEKVYLVIKGDVSGSVEAVLNTVASLGNSEVQPEILRSGVGPISQNDIDLAAVAQGYVIAFNTTAEPGVRPLAESKSVGIIEQNIIYRLADAVKSILSDKLAPTVHQKVTGEAEVLQSFSINDQKRHFIKIAGCKVKNGMISTGKKVRVLRGKDVIYNGSLTSLKNKKKDVTEMRKDSDCGLAFEDWEDFRVGDQVQCYEEWTEKRSL